MNCGPSKRVKTEEDMVKFKNSPSYLIISSYTEKLCVLVKGEMDAPKHPYSNGIVSILTFLDKVKEQVDRIDPIQQPMRFGNKAFRTLHSFLSENAPDILLYSGIVDDAIVREIMPYLLDSFGNSTRIDYGTGHEASFFFALIILMEKKILEPSKNVILVVFRRYIELTRLITTKYVMEPAGSHGVWGLDDFHHLPFLFGAAQLIGHESDIARPTEILLKAESIRAESLFADCIRFIQETKGRFAQFENVAPLLSDLMKRDNWSHVCMSLLRMYQGEVLGKRPIVQHFFFGDTLRWD